MTTRIPGADEAVEDRRSGLLVESPEDGAERLMEFRGDALLRRSLRDGARQIAVERYSVEKSLDGYEDLWSDLARS